MFQVTGNPPLSHPSTSAGGLSGRSLGTKVELLAQKNVDDIVIIEVEDE